MRGDESISSVEGTLSRGKRDRIWKVCIPCAKGEISMPTLKRKLNELVQGECVAQKKLFEAEAEMDIRIWEQRNADIALYETNRELNSQRLELHQANQWAGQAQREKINSFGALEMRNKIFQENRARDCREIEEF